ncbi:MAG: hypothetical protein INQ03_16195 [Candidatus Heimdallarchaeota archaeon]|nr:hypothetical protein [Candidatus Heimdallarchaeota archaeon]
MMEERPQFITIMSSDGIPLLTQLISPNYNIPEPALISGFLSALQSFSSEVMSTTSDYMEINVSGQHLILLKRNKFNIGGMMNKIGPDLKILLNQVADEFETLYQPSNSPLDEGLFNLFKDLILSTFANYLIELTWKPQIVQSDGLPDLDCFRFIDGQRSINQIIHQSTMDESIALTEIFRNWINGHIAFQLNVSLDDYVQHNANTQPYLLSASQTCAFSKQGMPCFSPDSVGCKNVLRNIKGIAPVKVLATISDDVIDHINCMYHYNILDRLTNEVKQLYLIKGIIQNLFEISEGKLNFGDLKEIIAKQSDVLLNAGIYSEIDVEKDRIKVDKDITKYKTMEREIIKKIVSYWTSYLVNVISEIPKKKRSDIIQALLVEAQDSITEFYQFVSSDENVDFLYQIELLH